MSPNAVKTVRSDGPVSDATARRGRRDWNIEKWATGGVWLAVVAALCLVPLLSPTTLSVSDAASIFALGIVAVGQNAVTALSGQMSIGQGGLAAVGAYSFAVLWQEYDISPVVAFVVAPIIAGLVGLVIAGVALRLDGMYLAMVTLALVVSIPQVIKWDTLASVTQGAQGILLPPVPSTLFGNADPSMPVLCLSIAGFLIVALLTAQLRRSRHGLGLRMLRESDLSASLSGVSRTRARILAFVLSAVFAGLGGELLVLITGIVTPDSYTLMFSFEFLVMVVLGGMGSSIGALLGAALTWELHIHLSTGLSLSPLGLSVDILPWVIYGVIVIAVVLFFPSGLAGAAKQLMGLLTGARSAHPPGRVDSDD